MQSVMQPEMTANELACTKLMTLLEITTLFDSHQLENNTWTGVVL